mmetsp:Transcript_9296/g.27993  ORF Transcript_9296/g.27993 Transcript_9296/m.27993 type:complete len:158 (+) Transcript_9296:175-648(+)|eukprot:CAMPEP_0198732880 /NCGR_PEP_ID=MMETSP1475-20131203/40488_1 /TAXON_ID= ORGANISM="Unidentified sp., Strain CCMP1999" /NCGR_SAMPLE_ID=MMETSP1475 /ASSEMBLY_ACC=CAM_ASM_001111 /LENGTH=157 /DNA_ID=CAMNT_0044496063 /DNA_START=156 /DNA_END=629 /DNA_ORIENTATION=+
MAAFAHVVSGDLIKMAKQGRFDVILHGCNCYCAMDAGIAKQIKNVFPAAYEADLRTEKGSRAKLGTYSSATCPTDSQRPVTVVNAYTQHHWKGSGVLADYDAIESVFGRIAQDFGGKCIAYPKIGAGLAGGDWTTIKQIIDKQLEGQQHTLVEFKPQ